MNLQFVRMLQSMAEVEKNPRCLSKKYVIVDEEERQSDPASTSVPIALKQPNTFIVDPEEHQTDLASASVSVSPNHPDNVVEQVDHQIDPTSFVFPFALKHSDNIIVRGERRAPS